MFKNCNVMANYFMMNYSNIEDVTTTARNANEIPKSNASLTTIK